MRCLYLVFVHATVAVLSVTCALASGDPEVPEPAVTQQDFSGGRGGTGYVYRNRGKIREKPDIDEGRLKILTGRSEHRGSAAFQRTAGGPHRRIEASFRMAQAGQNEGFSFALLHTGWFGSEGAMWDPKPTRKTPPEAMRTPDWAEPNLSDSLAVGFDLDDPHDEDWFNPNGNFYDRPQRQVSLHWDGREVANALCETEMSGEEPVAYQILVEFVTGGAEVTVRVGESVALDRQFVPHAMPYEARAAFGAHGRGEAFLDDVRVEFLEPAAPSPAPLSVEVFRGAWLRPGDGTREREVHLPADDRNVERAILTVRYRGPMERDYWDRVSAVYAWDREGARHEIARIITPFMVWGADYRYDADVTDFLPLLHGRRKMAVMAGSNVGNGFLVDVSLRYYRRPDGVQSRPRPFRVVPLWNGSAHFDKEGQVEAFFEGKRVRVPRSATRGVVRTVVSGHGVMEFTELARTLTVGDLSLQDPLWTTDCWLNPHRRQFGTWKFDRGGWCPGAVVDAWVVDITGEMVPGRPVRIDYAPDPFEADKWASHVVASHVIFYRGSAP